MSPSINGVSGGARRGYFLFTSESVALTAKPECFVRVGRDLARPNRPKEADPFVAFAHVPRHVAASYWLGPCSV